VSKVYVRNTGQNALTSLSVYINGVPAHFNVTPSSISAGQIGTVTIYDFIAEGDTIKLTTPSGFSTSKKAPDPCRSALLCWKLDEGSGTAAYDSSAYGKTGSLYSGALWTSGHDGGAIQFDGTDDYVEMADMLNINTSEYGYTISAWIFQTTDKGYNWNSVAGYGATFAIATKTNNSVGAWGCGNNGGAWINVGSLIGSWHYVAAVYTRNLTGFTPVRMYFDGEYVGNSVIDRSTTCAFSYNMSISKTYSGYNTYFGGKVDEVRIYNRDIY